LAITILSLNQYLKLQPSFDHGRTALLFR